MTITPTKGFFTPKELAERWGETEDNLQRLVPYVIIDGSPYYHYNDVIKYENNEYYFTPEDLAYRWGMPEDKIKRLLDSEADDKGPCYSYNRVIEYEKYNYFTPEDLAERWSVSVDEIKKIDKFVDHCTIHETVHYYCFNIYRYEQSPKFMFKKDEGKES